VSGPVVRAGKPDAKAVAAKAAKAVKKGSFKKSRKPRFSVVFHRPKTLKRDRAAKYPRVRCAAGPPGPFRTPCLQFGPAGGPGAGWEGRGGSGEGPGRRWLPLCRRTSSDAPRWSMWTN
jgi:hypothetical protein